MNRKRERAPLRILLAAVCAALLLGGCGTGAAQRKGAEKAQAAEAPAQTVPAEKEKEPGAEAPAQKTPEPKPDPTPETASGTEPEAAQAAADPALQAWLDYLEGDWRSPDQAEPYPWGEWLRSMIDKGLDVSVDPVSGTLTVTEDFKGTSVSMEFSRTDEDHMRITGTEGARWERVVPRGESS